MPLLIAIVVFAMGYWVYENWTQIGKTAYYWTKLQSSPDCETVDEAAEFCGGGLGFVLGDTKKKTFVNPYTSEVVTIGSSRVGDFCNLDNTAIFEHWTKIFHRMAAGFGAEDRSVKIEHLSRSGRTLEGRASWTIAEIVKGRNGNQRAIIGAHCDGEAYSFAYVGLDPEYPVFSNVGPAKVLAAFKPPQKLAEAFNP